MAVFKTLISLLLAALFLSPSTALSEPLIHALSRAPNPRTNYAMQRRVSEPKSQLYRRGIRERNKKKKKTENEAATRQAAESHELAGGRLFDVNGDMVETDSK